MKVLFHHDTVRLPAWDSLTAATVFSLYGFARDNGCTASDVDEWLTRGEELAGTVYGGSVAADSMAYYEAKRAEVADAITLDPGEIVEIDGRWFEVAVVRGCDKLPIYSDPIRFVPLYN